MELTNRQFRFRLLVVLACFLGLSILALVLLRVGLANDVTDELAAIRAAGLPTNGSEANEYYPAVAAAENAAIKMADAFALLTNFNDVRSNQVDAIQLSQRKLTLTPEDRELMTGYCAMNSNAMSKVKQAIQLPGCRYPVDLSLAADALLPHLAPLKKLARIAEFGTLVDTANFTTNISTMIGMARTLDTEPVLISKLVRIALLSMAETTLERRLNLGGLDEPTLIQLSQLFAGAAKTNQMANALVGERAIFFRYFRMSGAEIQGLSKSGDDDSSEPIERSLSDGLSFSLWATGFFERDLRFYLGAMKTNISLASIFPKNSSLITTVEEHISQTSRHNYYILSGMLLPALGAAIIKEANGLAQVRAAQTALAVERFRLARGRLPEKLSELTPQFLSVVPDDPFDGRPLRYHRLDTGYVIYSIGKDGEDNGGRERPANAKSTDQTHYDLPFTVER